MEIIYAEGVKNLMEERGIKEEDVQALFSTDTSDLKTMRSADGSFLSRVRLDNVTVYAEYTKGENSVTVKDLYSHMVTFANEEEV